MRCCDHRAVAVSAVLITAGLGLFGCKSKRPNELPVYPVKGRFTYKGEPVGHALVAFYPTGDPGAAGPRARTRTNANGEYELTTYELNDGAPEGSYEVSLCWPPTPIPPDELEPDKPPDRLKYEYYNPRKSKLKAVVKPERNVINFDLP